MFRLSALKQYLQCDSLKFKTLKAQRLCKAFDMDRGVWHFETFYISPKHNQKYTLVNSNYFVTTKRIHMQKIDDISRLNSWLLSGFHYGYKCEVSIESCDVNRLFLNIIPAFGEGNVIIIESPELLSKNIDKKGYDLRINE